MNDLISVLLPLYNAEKTLWKCLKGIRRQSYPDFEVIAVNDGSEDSSGSILKTAASQDKRIRVFTFSANRGIVAALNYGIDQCRGDWIARMDADDIMHSDRLLLQRDHFKTFPETDVLGAGIRLFREDDKLTPGQIRYQDWSNSLLTDQAIKADIFAESPIMHPTFFLRKGFYGEMGGYKDNPWAEDYDFLLRAYARGARFAKLSRILLEKGDSPTRLVRTDVRCKRKAMFHAKAYYFSRKRDFFNGKDKLVIAGSGSSGRMVRKALEREGINVSAFVDNAVDEPGRTISGLPVFSLCAENADRFFADHGNTFFVLCIGVSEGRQMMENMLVEHGFILTADYLRFI